MSEARPRTLLDEGREIQALYVMLQGRVTGPEAVLQELALDIHQALADAASSGLLRAGLDVLIGRGDG
jgi:hypothetical protein